MSTEPLHAKESVFLVNAYGMVRKIDTTYIFSLLRQSVSVAYTHGDSALSLNNKMLEYSLERGFADGIAIGYMNAGVYKLENGSLNTAISYFQKAYSYCRISILKDDLIPSWHTNVGSLYFFKAEYEKAATEHFNALKALVISDTSGRPDKYIDIYNNLSSTYIRLGNTNLAFRYTDLAKKLAVRHNLRMQLANTVSVEAYNYLHIDDFNNALQSYMRALSMMSGTNNVEVLKSIYNGIGETKLKQNKPEESIPWFIKALNEHTDYNPITTAIFPKYNLALALYKTKKYEQAEATILDALKEAEGLNFVDSRPDAHRTLALIYEATGRYKQALDQQRMYETMKDSLFTRKILNDVTELELKYNTVQKDNKLYENRLLINEQKLKLQQKNIWIGVGGLSILLLGISSFFIYRNLSHKQKLLLSQLSIVQQEEEIKLLKANIDGAEQERLRIGRDLHDGIGGILSAAKLQLGSLRLKHTMLVREDDFEKAVHLVDEATTEVRKTAHNLTPEIFLNDGLLQAVTNYCNKITSSSGPKIKLQTYGVIPKMNAMFELSVYRILQELVNNTLKHAQASGILVQLNWQENNFHLAIEDDGIGMDTTIVYDNGMGIRSIIDRVKILNGHMEIDSTPGQGTSIYIDFDTSLIRMS